MSKPTSVGKEKAVHVHSMLAIGVQVGAGQTC